MVDNPCDICLLEPMCRQMCPRAKPYFDALTGKNPNYFERVRDDGFIVCGTSTSKQTWVIKEEEAKLNKNKQTKYEEAERPIQQKARPIQKRESIMMRTLKSIKEIMT